MMDDKPSGPVTRNPSTQTAPVPPPPQNPTSATAQQLTDVEERMSSFERATLRWTRAMFVVTTATALFIGFQWREMHDAGEQTERIIKADERLAKGMEDSVTQAKRGLDASIEISRNDQRAWLGIAGIQILSFQAGQKISINIPLQNSGKTAAVNVRTRSFVHLTNAPINAASFSAKSNEPFRSHMTIFPNITNANISIVSPWPLNEAQSTAIKNGNQLMYAFGEISYRDVFDRLHHTYFCGVYSQATPNNMQYCNEYNGAD